LPIHQLKLSDGWRLNSGRFFAAGFTALGCILPFLNSHCHMGAGAGFFFLTGFGGLARLLLLLLPTLPMVVREIHMGQ
jgi:hypothetical protein